MVLSNGPVSVARLHACNLKYSYIPFDFIQKSMLEKSLFASTGELVINFKDFNKKTKFEQNIHPEFVKERGTDNNI